MVSPGAKVVVGAVTRLSVPTALPRSTEATLAVAAAGAGSAGVIGAGAGSGWDMTDCSWSRLQADSVAAAARAVESMRRVRWFIGGPRGFGERSDAASAGRGDAQHLARM